MSNTAHYALVGSRLTHTLSPFIHESLFAVSGIKADYSVIDTVGASINSVIRQLRQLDGFNVTIPFKKVIISLLDSLDKTSKICNAVNTVFTQQDKFIGYNTDSSGFLQSLDSNVAGTCKSAVIIGAGGAANAIAFALAERRCKLIICTRSIIKANALAEDVNNYTGIHIADASSITDICNNFDLLVNATPVGMYPNVNSCSAESNVVAMATTVFDAVYNPIDTELLKTANQLGKKTISGIDMLVYQAADAHKIWYGAEFDKKDLQSIIINCRKILSEQENSYGS